MLRAHAEPQDHKAFTIQRGGDSGVELDLEQVAQENERHSPTSCQQGGNCELIGNSGNKGWPVQRLPAYWCRQVSYRQIDWISTRELARKLDQLEQYTHHHSSQEKITARHFILLDARGETEYRTNHIHGAIHLPVSARLCMLMRPGVGHIQRHFFDPPRKTPLSASIDKPILQMLQHMDKEIEIVVYCALGYRSGWIVSALSKQGYNVSAMYGGLCKWESEGREIFKFKSDNSNPEYAGYREHIKAKLSRPSQQKSTKKKSPPGMSSSYQDLIAVTTTGLMDSQGMHVNRSPPSEEASNSSEPHQFVVAHMLGPSSRTLKPNFK